jgi:hypothetical protein
MSAAQTLKFVLMYENGKMRPVETIPGMGRGGG